MEGADHLMDGIYHPVADPEFFQKFLINPDPDVIYVVRESCCIATP
jgi:hypothetical protein